MKRHPKRDMLDRLLVRVPALAGLMAVCILRLRPGSGLRRRLISFQVQRGFAAMARSDVEVVMLGYEPDAEVWMRSMAGVGMSDRYRGSEGVRAVYAEIDDVFADWRWIVRAIADGGDRLAIRADLLGHGRSSGVQIAVNDGGTAVKFSARGLVAWQEWFAEADGWHKALNAVGLSDQSAHADS
jgi:SnoaL-like domain